MAIPEESSSVLVLCQLFYPELISTGQIVTELAEELVKLGMEVDVICGPPTILDRKSKVPRFLSHKGIRIKRVFGTRFSKLSMAGKFMNQLTYASSAFLYLLFNRAKKPVLVFTEPPFLGFICAVLRKIKGRPYIFVALDVYPDVAVKLRILKEKGLIARLWEWSNRFVLKNASRVIVLGRCMENVILNKGKDMESLSSKTHVVPMWSDDRRIKPVGKEENPFMKKWNLNGKFVAGYSGNMGRFHDMETIMGAARALDGNRDICFLFIGEGYKKRWMGEYAGRWKLGNCRFHGYVEREELGLSLGCADVGLVSLLPGQEGLSVPSKTFGLMAAGIPVIGIMNRNCEIASVIEENDCGFVIDPGNVERLVKAILELESNPELCHKLGKNGLFAVKNKYNLKNAAHKYYSILRSFQE